MLTESDLWDAVTLLEDCYAGALDGVVMALPLPFYADVRRRSLPITTGYRFPRHLALRTDDRSYPVVGRVQVSDDTIRFEDRDGGHVATVTFREDVG